MTASGAVLAVALAGAAVAVALACVALVVSLRRPEVPVTVVQHVVESGGAVDVPERSAQDSAPVVEVAELVTQPRTAGIPFQTLVEHCDDVMLIVDRNECVRYANPALHHIFGYPNDLIVGHRFSSLVTDEDGPLADDRIRTALAGLSGESSRFEIDVLTGDQAIRPAEVVAVNCRDTDGVDCLVVTMRDIADFRSVEAELAHQAFHDPLTGLPNRSLFLDRVDQALRRRVRPDEGNAVAMLYLDLDGFKGVNDTMGHDAGDELLRAVGYRLVGCLRSGDTVARMGGDEFAVLLDDASHPDEGIIVAQRILEVLSLPLDVCDEPIAVQASIGLATAGNRSTTESLLRAADLAMLRAKQAGKARVAVYESSTDGI